MKKIFAYALIIITFSFLLFFIGANIYTYYTEPNWETVDTKTIGTVTKIDAGKGGGAWFMYKVDGKVHNEFDGLQLYGLTPGEK